MTVRSALLASCIAAVAAPALADEVNVYTTRQAFLIEPVMEAFTAETGIAVNLAYIDQGLVERLRSEGARSPADLVMTVDIANLQQIVDAVRRALEITPPELASDIVDRGIVMTGGGALIRGLDLLLAHETDLPIHVDEEPLTCVVRGAGRILDEFERFRNVLQN